MQILIFPDRLILVSNGNEISTNYYSSIDIDHSAGIIQLYLAGELSAVVNFDSGLDDIVNTEE